MRRDAGSQGEAERPSRPRPLAVMAFFLLLAGGLVAGASGIWYLAAARGPSDHLISRVMSGGLAVALIGVAGKKYFWDAPSSRRPRWQRSSAVLVLLWAAYLAVHALRGA